MSSRERPGDEWLPLLHEIADRADGIALQYFRTAGLDVKSKVDGSPVSTADRAIESMAREVVAARAPEAGVYGEEEGEAPARGGIRVIIDPIDGTRNFVRGIPVFASLLAVECDGGIVTGVVSAPALQARWHAARGHGAFAGKRRLQVSAVRDLARAHVFHGDLSGHGEGPLPPRIHHLLTSVERTRGFGDFYQHMLVAEGAGEIAIDPNLQPWDIAAVKIIVEEAGGRCTSVAGDDAIRGGSLLSSNGALHDAALAVLRPNAD
ncbi:MAG: inositol monophosphatase family protein [Nitrospirota bacterium]|jgi:histidinol-phosphatase